MKILLILIAGICVMQSSAQSTVQVTPGAYITGEGASWIVLDNSNVINDGNIFLSTSGNTFKTTGSTSTIQSGTGITQLYNLTNNTSATYTLAQLVSLYNQLGLASGTLASSGFLTMKSLPSNTAVILPVVNGAAITGDVIIERFISSLNNRAYRLLTPSVNTATSSKRFIRDNWQEGVNNPTPTPNLNPVPNYGTHITGSTVGANGFDATITGQGSLFTYQQTPAAWVPATNTIATPMDAKTGYLLYVRGDRSMDLNAPQNALPSSNTTLRATGSVLVNTQTYPALESNGGFSLVTNPYVSAVSWNKIYNDPRIPAGPLTSFGTSPV